LYGGFCDQNCKYAFLKSNLWDQTFSHLGGAALGTIVSLVFSRAKKTWPIWLGTGIG